MARIRPLRTAIPLALALAAAGCGPASEARLFLLVTVDTLRADHLGAYGSERGLTPRLDELARESEVYTAAYAPTSFTLPSIAALFTGRYPESLGVRSNVSRLPEQVPTLASELQRRGWRTGAVVSNLVLRGQTGLAAGFERYDDALPQREVVRNWPERIARDTTDATLELIDALCAGPVRCFVWAHFMDPHGPYTPPPELRERYLEEERRSFDAEMRLPIRGAGAAADRGSRYELGSIPAYQAIDGRDDVGFYRAGYAGEIRYLDREIGRLWDGIEARGLGRGALVVFTADHGEALGENDYWFAHGADLTDALVRVPLWVRDGSAPREARRRDDVVSLVDLFPTLLGHLEGVSADASYPGRDLFAPGADERASVAYLATLGAGPHARRGIVDGDRKLVLSRERGGERWERRLYRRGDDRSRLSEPRRQQALESRLDELRRRLPSRSELRQQLSKDEAARLEALGYVAEPAPAPQP